MSTFQKKNPLQPVLLAMGANLSSEIGPPDATITAAVRELEANGFSDILLSGFYRTPAFPPGSGPDFVNAAAVCSTDLGPAELLAVLKRIELVLGRTPAARWAARKIDIDLIAVGDLVLPSEDIQTAWRNLDLEAQSTTLPDELILPHPRLQDRAFVLVPLADVASDWRHPILGKTVAELLCDQPKANIDAVTLLSGVEKPI